MTALKGRRQQKEQKVLPGSEGPFNPKHGKQTHGEDPNSPNQKLGEATSSRGTANSLGGEHKPRTSVFKSKLLPNQRTSWQHSGNQKMKGRYTEEETSSVKKKVLSKMGKMKEENNNGSNTKAKQKTSDLGRPDTGGKSDTVTVNPVMQDTIMQSR